MNRHVFLAVALALLVVANTQSTPSTAVVEEVQIDQALRPLGQLVEVDWTAGVVRARGAGTAASGLNMAQARLRAMGAARADAQRLLAMAIGEVRITSDTIVQDYVLASDTVRLQLDTVLQGVVFPEGGLSVEQLSDGSYIVYTLAEISLYGPGSIGSAVYQGVRDSFTSATSQADYSLPSSDAPFARPIADPGADVAAVPLPASGPEPTPDLRGANGEDEPASYTGLIIDASAFSVDATMAPRVFSESGDVVYGILSTSTEYANDVGVVGYHHSIEAARRDARVGDYPLVIAAIDVVGKNIFREHPVISAVDADVVHAANELAGFLEQAKVAFVIR